MVDLFEKIKRKYAEERKDLENYFKERRSAKVEKALNKFYEEYFSDNESNSFSGVGPRFMPPQRSVNGKMEQGVGKIADEAHRLNIPEIEVAGYVFDRLLFDACSELLALDKKLTEKTEKEATERIRSIMNNDSDYDNTNVTNGGIMFGNAWKKMEACEAIARDYSLGQDAVEVVERNLKRIKRREDIEKVMGNAESLSEAVGAFRELQELIEGQEQNIVRESTALIEQQIGRWKSN